MKQLKLDQAIRKLTFGGLEIPLVVIGLGVTGLKKTGVVYLRGFWGERGGGGGGGGGGGERSGGVISCV